MCGRDRKWRYQSFAPVGSCSSVDPKNLLGSYPAPCPHLAVLSALVILLYRRGKSLCGRNDVSETAPLIRLRIAACIMWRDLPGLPPASRTASDKSWAWRPGNEASCCIACMSQPISAGAHLACTWYHSKMIFWSDTDGSSVHTTFLMQLVRPTPTVHLSH